MSDAAQAAARGDGPAKQPARARPEAPERGARPTVALVSAHWGETEDEATSVTRLVAGALARSAEVQVIHLGAPATGSTPRHDSVFRVHGAPLRDAQPLRAGVLRAALGHDGRRRVPARAGALLAQLEGWSDEVPGLLAQIKPACVLLVGHHQPHDHAAAALGRARVVALPLLGSGDALEIERVRSLVTGADLVLAAHPGEQRRLRSCLGAPGDARVAALPLALALNWGAVRDRLYGVRHFGRYVVLLRCFPGDGRRFLQSITHEVLRDVLGSVAVAEVDGQRWRISDRKRTLVLPVGPSRVNLWRLMAHAEATVDVRPSGPVGREAIESMLLGTPVVVPDGSAAAAHVAKAGGGLWYRDIGELFDATRLLLDPAVRSPLSAQGRRYAEAHHSDLGAFVHELGRLVLGP